MLNPRNDTRRKVDSCAAQDFQLEIVTTMQAPASTRLINGHPTYPGCQYHYSKVWQVSEHETPPFRPYRLVQWYASWRTSVEVEYISRFE